MKDYSILITSPQESYELIDSGEGEKLERFGDVVLARPDPQALWPKKLSKDTWKKSDGHFTRDDRGGEWELSKKVPQKWQIAFGGLTFAIKPTAFKHVGIFPEQLPNWQWTSKLISDNLAKKKGEIEILNLFGYTGGASLSCAKSGAKVVHIDGSKAAVSWARENAELSGLKDRPIRWIVEDVRKFVEREIRRGRSYDGIIMDPPAFGHGPENELWKIDDHFIELMSSCFKLLKPEPIFFLVNGYSAGYSAIAYKNNLVNLQKKFGGNIDMGELAIEESVSKSSNEKRILPAGIFARWSAK